LAAILMVLLGYSVMSKANEATTVSKVGILGETCTPIPTLAGATGPVDDGSGSTDPVDDGAGSAAAGSATTGSAAVGSDAGSDTGSNTPSGSGSAGGPVGADPLVAAVAASWCTAEAELKCTPTAGGKPLVVTAVAACDDIVDYRLGYDENLEPLHAAKIAVIECVGGKKHDVPAKSRRAKPTLDESTLQLTFTLPVGYTDTIAEHWSCEIQHVGNLAELDRGKLQIFLVLIGSGLLLLVGLGVYGIKMTHKVAGPLFKVSLYLGKMRDGRLDKVYNLRKGDQLVSFYDHFKTAHAGVVELEKADIAQLKAVIAAAESAGAGEHAAVAELRAILGRKEKTIE
ncbi:MAG: hypothetical protein NT062_16790, partial [Proteobacteria bacterium]|nr:hypothetical protein [Pseudomonadota bacterium]